MSSFDAISKHIREHPNTPFPKHLRRAALELVRRHEGLSYADVELSPFMISALNLDQPKAVVR